MKKEVDVAEEDQPQPMTTDSRSDEEFSHQFSMFGRAVLMKPGEMRKALWSAAYFFCILASWYVIRPARETMGIEGSFWDLPWLMTGTQVLMFIVAPAFGFLCARMPRRRFIPVAYEFFALNLALFYAAFFLVPDEGRRWIGYAFFMWVSVFNLFIVSLFWSLMADGWSNEQAKRLFGFVGVGGTLGALAGSGIANVLTGQGLDHVQLLLISVVLLQCAMICFWRLKHLFHLNVPADANQMSMMMAGAEPGRSPWKGMLLLVQSPYLLMIAAYIVCYALLSSILYVEQGRLIEGAFEDRSKRANFFATIDLLTNLFTLLLQIFLTGRFIRTLGVGIAMTAVPVVTILGFLLFMIGPEYGIPVLGILLVFQVSRRGLNYGLSRPAREVLYTVVGAEEKYKAKNFIDTFVYRGADVVGGWIPVWLAPIVGAVAVSVGVVVGAASIGISTIGVILAIILGRAQVKRAKVQGPGPNLRPKDGAVGV